MMGFTWWGKQPEHRQEPEPEPAPEQDAVQSSWITTSPLSGINIPSAFQAAAAPVALAFSAAEMTGTGAAALLTRTILRDMIFEMITTGQAFAYVRPDGVFPCRASVETGGYNPESWRYRVTLQGPSMSMDRVVGRDAVLHFMWRADKDRPWIGVSPFASDLAEAVKSFESAFRSDASAVTAQYLPTPLIGPPGTGSQQTARNWLAQAYTKTFSALRSAKGALVAGPSFQAPREKPSPSVNTDPAFRVAQGGTGGDKPERWGPEVPQTQILAYEVCVRVCLAALGFPGDLIFRSDGTTQRESYRQELVGLIQPIAASISDEVARKLGPVTFDFTKIAGMDSQARTRALNNLIAAGVPLAQALEKVDL